MRRIVLLLPALVLLLGAATSLHGLPAAAPSLAATFAWHVSPTGTVPSTAPVHWGESPHDPAVIKDGNVYYMYYSTDIHLSEESYGVINLATSYDGRNWSILDGFNIVMNRTPGTFNYPYGPSAPSVLKEGGIYKMWYHVGISYLPMRTSIGYATSPDGIHWSTYPEAVLSPGSFPWDSDSLTEPVVLKDGQSYRMYYVANDYAEDSERGGLAMATSADGIHWTKHPSLLYKHNAVSSAIQSPTIVRMLGGWHMWYSFDGNIYYATSPDGLSWTQVRQEAALNACGDGGSYAVRPAALADEDGIWIWFNNCYGIGSAWAGYPAATETATPTVTPTREGTPIAYQVALYLPVVVKGSPPPTPTATRTAVPTPAASGWVDVLADDFEAVLTGYPGKWQVVQQGGHGYGWHNWAIDRCRVFRGGYSAWAVAAGDPPMYCGAPYDNGLENWMTAFAGSLQGFSAAELRFQTWLNTDEGSDGLCALASRDGRQFGGGCLSGSSNGAWVQVALDLAQVPGLGDLRGSPQIWIAFVFLSDGAGTRPEGSYLDNVQVRVCTTASCLHQAGGLMGLQSQAGRTTWNVVMQRPASAEQEATVTAD